MKFFPILLSFGITAIPAFALPASEPQFQLQEIYSLDVTSPNDQIDGLNITNRNGALGIYEDQGLKATQVLSLAGAKANSFELHTYPTGFADHVIALQGDEGLKSLVDIVKPSSTNPGVKGGEWRDFRLENGKITHSKPGNWIAMPGSDEGMWDIKWWDGDAIITDNYMPIEINARSDGTATFLNVHLE